MADKSLPIHLESTNVIRQPLTFREKEEVLRRAKYACAYCGCQNRLLLTVEHKIPLKRGGTNEKDNLTCSCFICNQLKGNLTDDEYRRYYRALHDLHKLCKAHIKLEEPRVEIKQHHYPAIR